MKNRQILQRIHHLLLEIEPPDEREISHLVQRRKQYEKWGLIVQYIEAAHIRIPSAGLRSSQWRRLYDRLRKLHDRELLGWIWEQIEIAQNHERGVQDYRPNRKSGTVSENLLIYARKRLNKARRVLEWEEKAQSEGCFRVNSHFHARSREILQRLPPREDDEQDQFRPDEPWIRS